MRDLKQKVLLWCNERENEREEKIKRDSIQQVDGKSSACSNALADVRTVKKRFSRELKNDAFVFCDSHFEEKKCACSQCNNISGTVRSFFRIQALTATCDDVAKTDGLQKMFFLQSLSCWETCRQIDWLKKRFVSFAHGQPSPSFVDKNRLAILLQVTKLGAGVSYCNCANLEP